nr:immunoglobulin light chain junction region [Macaca mulatta]MOW12155.1 immunoglobulin light chain junction region [Macaca mulatta]
CQHGHYILTF